MAVASFRNFLRAVASHWVVLVGGSTVIVLLGVGERLSGRNVPLWVYIFLLIALALWAGFMAWRDERNRVIERDLQIADLVQKAGSTRSMFMTSRLTAFLEEANEVSVLPGSTVTIEELARYEQFVKRVENFLETFSGPAAVIRFRATKALALEEMINEFLSGKAEMVSNTHAKLVGFFQDASITYYYDNVERSELAAICEALPIRGTDIVIYVRLVNVNPTPTRLHNFSLVVESESGGRWIAEYPKEPELHESTEFVWIPPESIAQEERMTNLINYLDDPSKLAAQGLGIDGYVAFRVPGWGSEATESNSENIRMTLVVEDSEGITHPIEDRWGRKPRPSQRLSATPVCSL
jgi:hypothetical protein